MKTKKFIFLLHGLVIISLLFSGCIFVVGGIVGALGGYVISHDTIQGETSQSFSTVWDAAVEVMHVMGEVSVEDKQNGSIIAKSGSSTIWVTIEEIVSGAVRLRVKARKNLFPNIKLSQNIYVKIIENAAE